MYSNKVEICGVNTAKLPVLMEKEKMELLRRCRQGDRQAREELVSGNLRLVLTAFLKKNTIAAPKLVIKKVKPVPPTAQASA